MSAATTTTTTTVPAPARPAIAELDRWHDAELPGSLCLALLTAATIVALCRVFPDWEYLGNMLVVGLGTHAVATGLRVARTPLYLAAPVMLLAIVELLAVVYYRDTLTALLPGSRTFELMRIDVRLVVEQFPITVAPVPSAGSYATATAAAVALCAALSDTFAFRALGRLEAVVPSAVVFVFTAALGTDSHRVTVAALWVAAAMLTLAVLRFRRTSDDAAWMGARRLGLVAALPAIVLSVGLTAVVAIAVAPRLPGAGKPALVDARNRDDNVTEVLNPLVDIGAELRNRGNLELFTVDSSDGGHYWRQMALPRFNGRGWEPANEDIVAMGDRSDDVSIAGSDTRQVIRIANLGGNLVPAAYRPTRVSPSQVFWAVDSQTLVLPDKQLQQSDQIAVQSVVIHPTPDVLRPATVDRPPSKDYLVLPPGIPESAVTAAQQVTQNAATPYDKAVALQNWFRDDFRYNTDVQLGNSNDAIDAFLRQREGFCQQFAGTFAVMARLLKLPARVAVGFTPGDLGADGLFHVYGRHAHAWPEVWFDRIGWVAFEPTPGRGNGDTVGYTGAAAQQATPDGRTGDPTPTTAPGPTTVPGNTVQPTTTVGSGRPGEGGGATTTTLVAGAGGGSNGAGSAIPWVLAGLLAALLGWVVITPRVVRLLARRHDHTARDRVISAWQRTLGMLSLAGAPPVGGATPLEYADTAERTTGVDHRSLRELAVHVTRAVYSPRDIDEHAAQRCEVLSAEIDATCRERTPTPVRVQAMVDPRLMRRRFAG